MSDKDDIRELLARYCYALDAERFEDLAALFAPDGVWETAYGTGRGRDGIAAQARSILPCARPRRVHLTTNIVIDLDGDIPGFLRNPSIAPRRGRTGRWSAMVPPARSSVRRAITQTGW